MGSQYNLYAKLFLYIDLQVIISNGAFCCFHGSFHAGAKMDNFHWPANISRVSLEQFDSWYGQARAAAAISHCHQFNVFVFVLGEFSVFFSYALKTV
jgi:hypothetical protein